MPTAFRFRILYNFIKDSYPYLGHISIKYTGNNEKGIYNQFPNFPATQTGLSLQMPISELCFLKRSSHLTFIA